MSDYQHDVFISLAHNSQIVRWVNERFLPLFKPFLAEELGLREEDIDPYVAKQQMAAGMIWHHQLGEHHARSKTLLALLSRPYRNSDWCRLEFSMMRAREDECGIRRSSGHALIIPVFVHDGEDPEYKVLLDGIEPIDLVRPSPLCSNCMSHTGEEARQLELRIRKIAVDVARAITIAPKYSAEWQGITCEQFNHLFTSQQTGSADQVPGRETHS